MLGIPCTHWQYTHSNLEGGRLCHLPEPSLQKAFRLSHGSKALEWLTWLCPCQQCTFTQDFTHSGLPLLTQPLPAAPSQACRWLGRQLGGQCCCPGRSGLLCAAIQSTPSL